MIKQFVTRKHKFDAGHRVMHERFKCHNLHGHEYHVELTFSYEVPKSLGYAIDFKEIKRIGCTWIDEYLDHGMICNPKDEKLIALCQELGSKFYVMRLTDDKGFCNPSAENIAKELFFIISVLLNQTDETKLTLEKLTLHETVNCYVDCVGIEQEDWDRLVKSDLWRNLISFKTKLGELEYDDRLL